MSERPGLPAPGQVRARSAAGRWLLAGPVLGTAMVMLDATAVNVALPSIGASLGAALDGLQWIVTGYALSLAGLILLGGALGDRAGRRRVFLAGVVWFALASALCAAAPDAAALIGARILQGVGGALLTPGSLAIIQASFAPGDRPRAIGAWAGLAGLASAAGPAAGGWLVQAAGWRWVFLLNLPLAAAVLAVSARHVPETRDPAAAGARFDVAGALLAALALAGVSYALIDAPQPGQAGQVAAAAVAGAVAAAGFAVVERRRTRQAAAHSAGAPAAGRPVAPMLPLDIFAARQFAVINVITFGVYGAFGGLLFLLVLQLQLVAGFSPVAAGSALLPVTAMALAFSAPAGSLAQRAGPRWLMTGGLGLLAAGAALMTRIGAHAGYLADVLPAVVVYGAGLCLTVSPLTATVLASAQVSRAGIASGVNNAVARAAGLLGVAALPAAAGLGTASFRQAASFSRGFGRGVLICAAILAATALLTAALVDNGVLAPSATGRPGGPGPDRRADAPAPRPR